MPINATLFETLLIIFLNIFSNGLINQTLSRFVVESANQKRNRLRLKSLLQYEFIAGIIGCY